MRLTSSILLRRLTIGVFVSALAFGGCSPTRRPTSATASTIRRTVGEVVVVDEERRFVLIDLQSNLYVPAPGVKLRTMHNSTETGRLKTSPEQKRPFVAADIIDGKPAVGDQVVQ
jgi:hypothetical protein